MNGLFSVNNVATMQILPEEYPRAALSSAQQAGNLFSSCRGTGLTLP